MKYAVYTLCCFLFIHLQYAFAQNLPANKVVEFNAKEIHEPLINPYSGLVNYGIESCYGENLRKIPQYIYPESIVYLRPLWGDLEPEEEKLNLAEFESIRDQHLKGGALQWAFRIVTMHPGKNFAHATPAWVWQAGAKGTLMHNGGREPQYGDSVYQQKFEKFVRKLAQRYDGDPRLAFVDISGFGHYGEWGDPETPQQGWEDENKQQEDTRKIIDIYFKAFKKTPLAISTHIIGPDGEDRYSVHYALQHGAWFRRDGIGSPFFHSGHQQLAARLWENRPVISEWYGIYSNYNDAVTGRNKNWSGWSFSDAVDQALDQHSLVAEMSRDLDVTDAVLKHPDFNRLALKTGYRLVLSKAWFPAELANNEKLIIRQIWKNQGVAKLYIKHPLRIYLTDEKGKEVFSAIDPDFDPTGWKRGQMYETYSSFDLNGTVPEGTYELKVALVDPTGKPAIALGMEGNDGQKRYSLGKIAVKGKVSGKAKPLLLNLARAADATGHVAVMNEVRPFYYVAPLNDGLMRVSVSDQPGEISAARQAYGITWQQEKEFTTIKFYAGETLPGEGGWFERDIWVEILRNGKWEKPGLVHWNPVYPLDDTAGNQLFTISFNPVRARGVRIGGFTGRRYSKWVSVREIEVYNTAF